MAKFNIGKSFKEKKFKYGGYSAVLTTMVLAIVLVINLVVSELDLKLDLTKNKLFSLSEQTTTYIKDLKSDITIIGVFATGSEDVGIKEILNKYAASSSKITVKNIDPEKHPEVATKYVDTDTKLTPGSLIVESGSKFKVIDSYDLYNFSADQQSVESLAVEQRVTSAIMYVTSTKNPQVYSLQGHSEAEMPAEIASAFENENYTINVLNLLSTDWRPEVGDLLLINSPKRDISVNELNKIKDYLSKGGRALIFADLTQEDMTNMKQLFGSYGVDVQKAVILESDANHMIQGYPNYLIPNIGNHTISNPLVSAKVPVITYAAQPIVQEKIKKDSIKIEPLLTTSNKAYGKTNLQSTTVAKQSGDLSGPFDVAIAITDELDKSDTTKNPRIVLFSSSAITADQLVAMSNKGNVDLIMNSMNWLVDRKENISIRAKDLNPGVINMTAIEQLTVAGIAVIVIPAIIAICGVTVWLRRRHL